MAACPRKNFTHSINMSLSYVLHDTNGDEFHLTQKYVRYGNRILDASFIATVSVKKHKLLFNNFKQNTTLPVLTVPFKKETDARHAMNLCIEFCDLTVSNPFYAADDERHEVFLVDAYGGTLFVSPEYLKYRDRLMSANDVRTVNVKGRRVLINHYKGNMNLPTMCVHFADKNAAEHALNTIESILWNTTSPDAEVSVEKYVEHEPIADANSVDVLNKPVDPAFLYFMFFSTGLLIFLQILRVFLGYGDANDEL